MEASLIPAGLVIQTLRETVPAFDYQNGGMTLCRDGYHLTLDYGRYAAAAAWYRVLLGGTAKPAAFPAFQSHLLSQINAVIGQLL